MAERADYLGSEVRLRSGMVFQIDVIPFSQRYFATRMEDGVAIADAALQHELQQRFSAVFSAWSHLAPPSERWLATGAAPEDGPHQA